MTDTSTEGRLATLEANEKTYDQNGVVAQAGGIVAYVAAQSLRVPVSIEEYPEWIQPIGSHDAYRTDDKVTHAGRRWRSAIDANVWEPGTPGIENMWIEIT